MGAIISSTVPKYFLSPPSCLQIPIYCCIILWFFPFGIFLTLYLLQTLTPLTSFDLSSHFFDFSGILIFLISISYMNYCHLSFNYFSFALFAFVAIDFSTLIMIIFTNFQRYYITLIIGPHSLIVMVESVLW